MKKIIFALLITTLFCVANEVHLDSKQISELSKSNRVLSSLGVRVVDGIEREDYFFLQLAINQGRREQIMDAFLQKQSHALYMGERYDALGKRIVFPKSDAQLKIINEAVALSYGKGKKDLYIITDPECRYCIKFENRALGKLSDYRVHVILYPLSTHSYAPVMVEWILQGKDDAERKERMEAIMIHHSTAYKKLIKPNTKIYQYASPEVKAKMLKVRQAGQILGVTGTPTVLNTDFVKIPWSSLIQ